MGQAEMASLHLAFQKKKGAIHTNRKRDRGLDGYILPSSQLKGKNNICVLKDNSKKISSMTTMPLHFLGHVT